MHEYIQILSSVMPLFLLMGVGATVRRAKVLNEEADRTLLDLCVHLLLPCLILDHVMANEALPALGQSPVESHPGLRGHGGLHWNRGGGGANLGLQVPGPGKDLHFRRRDF